MESKRHFQATLLYAFNILQNDKKPVPNQLLHSFFAKEISKNNFFESKQEKLNTGQVSQRSGLLCFKPDGMFFTEVCMSQKGLTAVSAIWETMHLSNAEVCTKNVIITEKWCFAEQNQNYSALVKQQGFPLSFSNFFTSPLLHLSCYPLRRSSHPYFSLYHSLLPSPLLQRSCQLSICGDISIACDRGVVAQDCSKRSSCASFQQIWLHLKSDYFYCSEAQSMESSLTSNWYKGLADLRSALETADLKPRNFLDTSTWAL